MTLKRCNPGKEGAKPQESCWGKEKEETGLLIVNNDKKERYAQKQLLPVIKYSL